MKRFDSLWLVTATLAITGLLCFSQTSLADVSSSPTASPTPAAKNGANLVPGADQVDELLTNPNLRAYAGSKSRWSMSNSITYDGGTISAPFGESRPNIAGASGTSLDTDLNDQLSVKLSINAVNSLLLGFGIRKMAPFTFSGPSQTFYDNGGKDMDFFDPSLTYQYIYKLLGIQAVAQVGATQYTRADIHSSQQGNLDKAIGFDQENIYELGNLSIGASIGFGFNQPTDPTVDYSRWPWWFDPYLEYKFNDTFNFRTVFDRYNYEYYPISGMNLDKWVQSIGIGCSVTRDLFLYPNIQFNPDNIVASNTNLGVTITLNLF